MSRGFSEISCCQNEAHAGGGRNRAYEDSDRLAGKGDRDEPEALTVPGAAACTHSRVLECQCVCDSVSICMCVCVVPMRLATEAGWKC